PSFLSALPRAPTSTLFPYTTLFRSHARGRRLGEGLLHDRPGLGELAADVHVDHLGLDRVRRDGGALEQCVRCPPHDLAVFECSGDRKSTRLNSSHQIISYAVFCLKK